MEIKVKKYKYVLLSFAILIIGCKHISNYIENYFRTPAKSNDIYSICSKGDTIDFDIFRKSERIIKTQERYFIWFDIYDEGNRYDQSALHLLVCDKNLILKGASIAFGSIDSINEDTLFGWILPESKDEVYKEFFIYRNDLPAEIKFNLYDKKNWNGNHRIFNTIIDSIKFVPNKFSVKLYLRVSEDIYAWPGREEYLNNVEHYSKLFNKMQVVEIPIASLHFDRLGTECIYIKVDNREDTWNEMALLDDTIIEKLFIDMWNHIMGK